MKPIVSVITPAYNAEKTIEKCLNSLFNQTLKDIEIIVVNDNSQDNTLKILNKYKDKIVLINNKKNLGPAGARNKALDVAKGTYIGFVDADDYVDETMYEKMVSFMSDEVDLVCCGRYNIVDGKLNPITHDDSITDPHNFSATSNYNCDKLFKKEIIDKYHLRMPEKYSYAEDFAFNIRYKFYAKKMHIISEPLYYYLADCEGSITNSYKSNLLNIIDVLEEMIEFFKEYDAFAKYEKEIVTLCAGFYVRRTREFYKFSDTKLQKKFVKDFLAFFKKNFKHYKNAINRFKTKYYRFYRSSYPLMLIYIACQQIRRRIKGIK